MYPVHFVWASDLSKNRKKIEKKNFFFGKISTLRWVFGHQKMQKNAKIGFMSLRAGLWPALWPTVSTVFWPRGPVFGPQDPRGHKPDPQGHKLDPQGHKLDPQGHKLDLRGHKLAKFFFWQRQFSAEKKIFFWAQTVPKMQKNAKF